MSDRIVDSLYVFVTSEQGWSANAERIESADISRQFHGVVYDVQEDLKVNPAHSTTTKLKEARRTKLTRHEGFDKQKS